MFSFPNTQLKDPPPQKKRAFNAEVVEVEQNKNALKAEVVGALETPTKEYKEGTLLVWSGLRRRKR